MFMLRKHRSIIAICLLFFILCSVNIAQNNIDYSNLQNNIKACFSSIEGANTEIGYVFYDSKGNEIASYNKNKALTPASNQKLLTSGAAYKYLTSTFKFQTIVMRKGAIINGQLNGDIIVYGSGDPMLGTTYNGDENSRQIFIDWAKKIKDAGIKSITGNVIFNKGAFDDEYRHPDWPEDQKLRYYEAPISALSFNDNCIQLNVSPGKKLSQEASISITPEFSGIKIKNSVYTRKVGGNPLISFSFIDNTTLEVSGTIPLQSMTYSTKVAVMLPVKYFANVFTGTLRESGITINGCIKIPDKDESLLDCETLIIHETSLMKILKIMNQKSQNYYAEQIFKKVGSFKSKKTGSFQTGSDAVASFLKELKIDEREYEIKDGSGLSKKNKISVNALLKVLQYFPTEMRQTLAVSGESEGTLRTRFNGNMKGKIYAKTGTINKVDALSGYIVDDNGDWHTFSIIVNTSAYSHSVVKSKMDAAVKVVFDYFQKNN